MTNNTTEAATPTEEWYGERFKSIDQALLQKALGLAVTHVMALRISNLDAKATEKALEDLQHTLGVATGYVACREELNEKFVAALKDLIDASL